MKRFEWYHCNNWFGQHQLQTFIKHSHWIHSQRLILSFSNSLCTLLIKSRRHHYISIMSVFSTSHIIYYIFNQYKLNNIHFTSFNNYSFYFQLVQLQIPSLYFILQLFFLFSINTTSNTITLLYSTTILSIFN